MPFTTTLQLQKVGNEVCVFGCQSNVLEEVKGDVFVSRVLTWILETGTC
jgi:hypothetical protein